MFAELLGPDAELVGQVLEPGRLERFGRAGGAVPDADGVPLHSRKRYRGDVVIDRLVDTAAGSGGRLVRRRLERVVQPPVTLGPVEHCADGVPLSSCRRVDREAAAREVPLGVRRMEARDEEAGARLTDSDRDIGQFPALFGDLHDRSDDNERAPSGLWA